MRKTFLLFVALALALAACGGLPTLEPTVTPTQGNSTVTLTPEPAPTATATQSVGTLITITGDVFLRDHADVRQGFLRAGAEVLAVCDGEWCVLASNGLHFWRGCTSNNPANLGCKERD